jgi:hypothetical protein
MVSPTLLPPALRLSSQCSTQLSWVDYSIRKPPDHGIITPPRRLSRLYTSFLGMNTQGIHCQLYSVAENKGAILRQTQDSNSPVLISTKLKFILNKILSLCKGNPLKDYPLRYNYLDPIFSVFEAHLSEKTG